MKRINLFVAAAGLLLAVFPSLINAQWQADVRLTHDTALSLPSGLKSVGINGDNIHVVWHDNRNGESEIYYKRSTNKGVSWTSDTRLTNAPGYSVRPSIAVYGSVLHVVWESNRDGISEVYYKKSTNNGSTWTADLQLTNDNFDSYSVSVAAEGYVHVVWMDYRFGDAEIYYKRSIDGGVNWGVDTRLTNNSADQKYPEISMVGSILHVVFEDERNGITNSEIYYKRSANNGVNWGSDTRLTNSSGQSWNPFVSASGSYVHAVWDDDRWGNDEILYKRSTDDGVNWSSDARLTNNAGDSYIPSISLSGIYAHVVWTDERNTNEEIYYKQSTNRGASWGSDTRLTNASGQKRYPSISILGSLVLVLWGDSRDGNFEIYYKRNPTGNPVGIEPIGSEIPAEFSLDQNYPNPFNPLLLLALALPKSGSLVLRFMTCWATKLQLLLMKI